MHCEIRLHHRILHYELTRKKVKNINLRIKADGSVHVSAHWQVPEQVINNFVLSKADFILKTQEKLKEKPEEKPNPCFTEEEIKQIIEDCCRKVYPFFQSRGVDFPTIKFRRMVSRWGSCQVKKGILTFNTNLRFAPMVCIEYVVLHEFTHFLQANHSAKFYEELVKVCPCWKECREKLKGIHLR